MGLRRRGRRPRGRRVKARSGLWGARASLGGGIIVYLALAALSIRWWPDEPFIPAIFVIFAGHSAAYLLHQELHRYGADRPS